MGRKANRQEEGPEVETTMMMNRRLLLSSCRSSRVDRGIPPRDGSGLGQRLSLPSIHPLLVVETKRHCRRAYSVASRHRTSARNSALLALVDRCSQNYARLYARRILELAMASAAAWKSTAAMREAAQKPPSQWSEWDKANQTDWTNELLHTVGATTL